jgi:uncharacterized protein YukE
MSWFGDPDDLDALARQLAAAATRVREQGALVRSAAGAARWRGPAADAFHASVVRETTRLERAATELDDAAAALHRHADAVRAEIARLQAIERAAVGLVRSGLSGLRGLVT